MTVEQVNKHFVTLAVVVVRLTDDSGVIYRVASLYRLYPNFNELPCIPIVFYSYSCDGPHAFNIGYQSGQMALHNELHLCI